MSRLVKATGVTCLLALLVIYRAGREDGRPIGGHTQPSLNRAAPIAISVHTTAMQVSKPSGTWGFIDKNARVVVAPQFFGARAFSDGVAAVLAGEPGDPHWAYINLVGKCIFGPRSDAYPQSFSEGLGSVEFTDGRIMFLDDHGRVALTRNAFSFSDGVAVFVDAEKNTYGYIDHAGKVIISPQFANPDHADSFREERAQVRLNDGTNRIGFIDKAGKLVIPAKYVEAISFSEGLAAVRFSKEKHAWGAIDRTGNVVIPPQFDGFFKFSNGRAVICYGGMDQRMWQVIDRAGKEVFRLESEHVGNFREGLARAEKGGGYGFVNTDGQFVIPPRYQNAHDFSEGLAAVQVNKELWGYIDHKGDYVIAPQYRAAKSFSCGVAAVQFAIPLESATKD